MCICIGICIFIYIYTHRCMLYVFVIIHRKGIHGDILKHREVDGWTDRQTDRQTDSCVWVDRHIHRSIVCICLYMLFRAFKQEKKKEMCIFPCAYVYVYIYTHVVYAHACIHIHLYKDVKVRHLVYRSEIWSRSSVRLGT